MSRESNHEFIGTRLMAHQPSELGIRAGVLLALWCDGWHHVPSRGVDWANQNCIAVRIDRQLATVDFFDLTKLVFLAHDEALRVEIAASEMPDPMEEPTEDDFRGLVIRISARQRGGEFHEDHPTLEAAVAKYRVSYPESGALK